MVWGIRVDDTFERILVEDKVMPLFKMARRDLGWIPTGDVLRGGNGKFINLIQKHRFPPLW
ncbi:MAG: hypothetical protein KO316_10350 [Methanobacterium sp.]|jgi:hypothetical protein|nr:hypothetical protein [Methanobacterium sp.]